MNVPVSSQKPQPGLLQTLSDERLRRAAYDRCNQKRLFQALELMFSTYFVPNEEPEMAAQRVALYVKSLAGYSDWSVHSAIDEWLNTQPRRPAVSELKDLAQKFQGRAISKVEAMLPAPAPVRTRPDADTSAKIAELGRNWRMNRRPTQ